jgi:hypothetical protein
MMFICDACKKESGTPATKPEDTYWMNRGLLDDEHLFVICDKCFAQVKQGNKQ